MCNISIRKQRKKASKKKRRRFTPEEKIEYVKSYENAEDLQKWELDNGISSQRISDWRNAYFVSDA